MANQKPQAKKQPEPQAQTMRPLTLRAFVRSAEQAVSQTKVNMAMKLARGSTKDMEDYNRQVGRMEGMDQCIGLLKDMLGQVEDAEANSQLPEMAP